jgi:PAS domain S-box-containing protein
VGDAAHGPNGTFRDEDLRLVELLAVPASLHDVDGRFVYINSAAERATGLSTGDMLGRHHTDPVPPESRANVAALFRRAVERGEATDFETVFVDGRGQLRATRAMHFPLRKGDEVVGVLIFAFDVRQPPSSAVGAPPRLTPRQQEILELIASGLTTAEIANELTISNETVRNHIRSILRELDAHTRPEAVANAQRFGLLSLPPLRPQQR